MITHEARTLLAEPRRTRALMPAKRRDVWQRVLYTGRYREHRLTPQEYAYDHSYLLALVLVEGEERARWIAVERLEGHPEAVAV